MVESYSDNLTFIDPTLNFELQVESEKYQFGRAKCQVESNKCQNGKDVFFSDKMSLLFVVSKPRME